MKISVFLVSLCLAMFCSFSAYADDYPAADIAPPVSDSAVLDSADPVQPDLQDSVEDSAPALTQDQLQAVLESTLSNGVLVRLDDSQLAEIATPETAATIWDKPFNEYTPQEGYALLTFVLVLAACTFTIFRRF